MQVVDIPMRPDESFHRGQVYTSVRDAIFDNATAIRYSAEKRKVLQAEGLQDCKVVLDWTDGGPEHNMQNLTVQIAHIAFFLANKLDILVAGRCCPGMSSFMNPSERVSMYESSFVVLLTPVRAANGPVELCHVLPRCLSGFDG